jgi:hypothetical protein
MEDKRRPKQRSLHREHVVTRTEEQLWVLVYEQLLPRPKRCPIPPLPSPEASAVDPAIAVSLLGV